MNLTAVPLISAYACRYFDTTRRYNYMTPKSYLELISLYKSLLAKQRALLAENKTRLENGVEKIAQASRQVADLQVSVCKHAEHVADSQALPGSRT